MSLAVLGVSHHTAPVGVRERMAFSPEEADGALLRLRDEGGVGEAVLLSTCNRTEVYLFPDHGEGPVLGARRLLERKAGALGRDIDRYLFEQRGEEVVRHLFQVCSGLDSLVVGEAEIQGQVRDAYERARSLSAEPPLTGPVLNRLFQMALSVGGRVRSETEIGQGSASVASVAVQLARKIFGSLEGKRVLVLGAGQTGELILQALSRDGARRVMVANRTYQRAEELARQFSGQPLPLGELARGIRDADIVLASTAAPTPIVTRRLFQEAFPGGLGRPLLMIDVAVPRDVAPELDSEPEVFLYNVDDLRKIVEERVQLRRGALPAAEELVRHHRREFQEWYASREVVPTLREIRGQAEGFRAAELERLLQGWEHLPAEDRVRLEEFSRRLTNKLLHTPTVQLRRGGDSVGSPDLVGVLRFLYGLDDERGKGREDDRSTEIDAEHGEEPAREIEHRAATESGSSEGG
ncbi:MAG: glutamyl-tRNA reductase [Gemmatimonadota bacterium]